MDIAGFIKACQEAGIDIRVSGDGPEPSMTIPLLSKTIVYDAEGNIIDEGKWKRQIGVREEERRDKI